jgi:hypothetical protein
MGMTDEERKELCARLRKNGYDMDAEKQAANEIEQLAKKLAEAEAALRNALLHYKISDVHFLDTR